MCGCRYAEIEQKAKGDAQSDALGEKDLVVFCREREHHLRECKEQDGKGEKNAHETQVERTPGKETHEEDEEVLYCKSTAIGVG